MKVVIESDANPVIRPGEIDDFGIIGARLADFHYVYDIPSRRAKQSRCIGGQTLIEQESLHDNSRSCHFVKVVNVVIDGSRSVSERLSKIFLLEERIFPEQVVAFSVRREDFQNAADGDSHTPDAGLSSALTWLYRYAVEYRIRVHNE
jgi:hypothetical protein